MAKGRHTKRLSVALVTFERNGDFEGVRPRQAQGACGWMGVKAARKDNVKDLPARIVGDSLSSLGLRLLELDQIVEIQAIEGAEELPLT